MLGTIQGRSEDLQIIDEYSREITCEFYVSLLDNVHNEASPHIEKIQSDYHAWARQLSEQVDTYCTGIDDPDVPWLTNYSVVAMQLYHCFGGQPQKGNHFSEDELDSLCKPVTIGNTPL